MAHNPSRYAVVQSTAVPPSVAQLRDAFKVLPNLVDADASSLAKDGFGIIIDSLSRSDAEVLTSALSKLGARVEIVCQDDFYSLPRPRRIRRLELGPEHFTFQDAMGRQTVVAWSHVVIVAAGRVYLTEFTSVQPNVDIGLPITTIQDGAKEERNLRLLLQLVLDTEPICLRLIIDDHLWPRSMDPASREPHFLSEIRHVCQHATFARLNRGAEAVRDRGTAINYPSKHAFEEEIIWLLWRHAGA